MTEALGTTSRKISRRFAASPVVSKLTPVALPPGRLMLATIPNLTGSPPITNTTGILAPAYNYDIDRTPMSAGLSPAGMAASLAATDPYVRGIPAYGSCLEYNAKRWFGWG